MTLFAFAAPPRFAWAGPGRAVSVQVSDDHPTVGDSVDVDMIVTSDEPLGSISGAGLSTPPEIVADGPSVSTSTSVQIVNGMRSMHSKVVLRWRLTPTQPGTFTIAGPSATVAGSAVQGRAITLHVAPGSGASTPDDFRQAQDGEDTINHALALDKGPNEDLFIHVIPDKTAAIVGEQVTVSFYVYFRVDFTMTEHKEAPLSDFLRIALLKDPGSTPQQTTTVGGKRYGVRLIDRVAAFPLHAGKLHTGSVRARFNGRRIGENEERISDEAVIDVTEPPEAGRPPGYVMGTVGHFQLKATVAPRTAEQNGSVSVIVDLSGTGNLPVNLKMPQQPGVEWLDPQRKDQVSTQDDKVGGLRTFGYVATLKKAGPIDLGTLELPYFDPETRSYEIASVALGTVDVRPAVGQAEPDASSRGDDDLLANLPKPRGKLSPYEHPDRAPIPTWGLGAAIACPPFLVGLGFVVSALGARAVRRRREARGGTGARIKEAFAAAKHAEKKGDVKELAAAIERAVHASIEEATGVKSRGLLRDALGAALETKGVAKDVSSEASDVLAECELLRFTPAADDKAMSGLVARATALTKTLRAKAG
jgi:hypothetical protein